jgi:predicted nucleic-acid-binding protein
VLGVDTNVLVRFLAADDDMQSQQAKLLMGNLDNQPIRISLIVLAEAFNVLTKVRKFPMDAVHEGYRQLLRSPGIEVEDPRLVSRALGLGQLARCGFNDALIALQNQTAGCSTTATFDRKATRLDAMTAVEGLL